MGIIVKQGVAWKFDGAAYTSLNPGECASEIARLTAELAEARALLQEAGKALDSLMFQFVRDNTGNFSEEAATYTKLKEAGYVE